jgi:hypothetical protein
MSKNPYLKPGRLSEVIAAITALGAYRYYKLTFAGSAERITDRPDEAERWGKIFREHPEFFRVSQEGSLVSLVWRRQHPKRSGIAFSPPAWARLGPPQWRRHPPSAQARP